MSDTKQGFDPDKQLTRADVRFGIRFADVTIRWSKAQQMGREVQVFSLPRMPGSLLCPVQALENIFELVPVGPQDPCFLIAKNEPLTYRQFQAMLKESISTAGMDATQYSSHSFRRGGASWSFLAGVPTEMIKLMGDWRSDAYLRYIEFPAEA